MISCNRRFFVFRIMIINSRLYVPAKGSNCAHKSTVEDHSISVTENKQQISGMEVITIDELDCNNIGTGTHIHKYIHP